MVLVVLAKIQAIQNQQQVVQEKQFHGFLRHIEHRVQRQVVGLLEEVVEVFILHRLVMLIQVPVVVDKEVIVVVEVQVKQILVVEEEDLDVRRLDMMEKLEVQELLQLEFQKLLVKNICRFFITKDFHVDGDPFSFFGTLSWSM